MKECRRCLETKPLTEFHRDKNRRDGHYCYCKSCHIAEVSARQACPERKARKREYDKQRVARLRDRLREQYRANYERKRPEKIAAAKRWSERNRDKRRLISQSYKHRRRAVERAGMTTRELAEWKRQQAKVCHWCGVKCARGHVVDHIKPLAKGGKHEAHNLCISCRSCNARKSARDPVEFAQMIGKLL